VNGVRIRIEKPAITTSAMFEISPAHFSSQSIVVSLATSPITPRIAKNVTSANSSSFGDCPRRSEAPKITADIAKATPTLSSNRPSPLSSAMAIHGVSGAIGLSKILSSSDLPEAFATDGAAIPGYLYPRARGWLGAPLRRMPRPSAASSGRPSAPRRNSVERPADG
jgi:hypothetical protein